MIPGSSSSIENNYNWPLNPNSGLETIYEIGIECDQLFQQHGGRKIQLVESLNTSAKWIEALKEMIISHNSHIHKYDPNHRILVETS